MHGSLELKNDDWVKAKETFRTASDATDGKDSYATLSLVRFISTFIYIYYFTPFYLVPLSFNWEEGMLISFICFLWNI